MNLLVHLLFSLSVLLFILLARWVHSGTGYFDRVFPEEWFAVLFFDVLS